MSKKKRENLLKAYRTMKLPSRVSRGDFHARIIERFNEVSINLENNHQKAAEKEMRNLSDIMSEHNVTINDMADLSDDDIEKEYEESAIVLSMAEKTQKVLEKAKFSEKLKDSVDKFKSKLSEFIGNLKARMTVLKAHIGKSGSLNDRVVNLVDAYVALEDKESKAGEILEKGIESVINRENDVGRLKGLRKHLTDVLSRYEKDTPERTMIADVLPKVDKRQINLAISKGSKGVEIDLDDGEEEKPGPGR